jgi:cysteinyl-tRNA synthetase
MQLQIYNSLSQKIEAFKPIEPGRVKMYTCGPTVYDYAQIGNFKTFVESDFVHRTLLFNNYEVDFVMNITDVGHLTGDNLGDSSIGEDRIERAVVREGKKAADIVRHYTDAFMQDYEDLNILKPQKFTVATHYIKEQIDLAKQLEKNGYAYKTSDGLYFDTSKFEGYQDIFGIDKAGNQEGARVDINEERRNPADFALWKFSKPEEARQQEWDSPWGVGYPGWHLECSAMVIKELGEHIDIHIGGEDHLAIHHPNEIAQSEGATGETFANYWMHMIFMKVDGRRMGKSEGNAYTLKDLKDKGFHPMALRYLYASAHYRTPLNFTWEALENAQNSIRRIYDIVGGYKENSSVEAAGEYIGHFRDKINDDINIPEALAVMWDMLKDPTLSEGEKRATALEMDQVLGFKIAENISYDVPVEVMNMARTREEYRKNNIWDKADVLRREIESKGYVIEDLSPEGFKVKRKI